MRLLVQGDGVHGRGDGPDLVVPTTFAKLMCVLAQKICFFGSACVGMDFLLIGS